MNKTYQIKINQGKDTKALDVPQAGPKGQAVNVKAVGGARYQLIDPETGYGPENIRVSRQGKDLKVSFEGSKTTDLVIEDYYTVTADNFNGLIGEAESGKFYEYIPENAAGMASVPMLADSGQVVGMALGGAEVAPAGAAVGVLAAGLFSPWLLGAGALGLAAAGGGGGSGTAATKDTTPPTGQTGALSPVTGSDSAALGDNKTNVTKPTITGKAEAGSTVEVSFVDPAGKVTGPYKTTADANGNYSLVVPDNLADTSTDTKGTQYTPVIKATDASGNSSTANGTPFVVDTKAAAVTVQIDADANPVGNNDGYINAAEKGSGSTSVTVFLDTDKMVAGDVITVSDGTTTKTVTLTADDIKACQVVTKDWALPTVEGQELKVKATVKDLAGNVSPETSDSATVDVVAPTNAGMITKMSILTDANNDGWVNSNELNAANSLISRAILSSTAKVGDKIVFTADNSGIPLIEQSRLLSTSDITKGYVDVSFAKPTETGMQTVNAKYIDAAGNSASDAVLTDNATLDTVAPTNASVNLGINIDTDKDNNGWVNKNEFVSPGTFNSHVTFDANAKVGDKIIFSATNGLEAEQFQTHILTSDDLKNLYFDFQYIPVENQMQKVTAKYADAAGNLAIDNAPLDQSQLDIVATSFQGTAKITSVTSFNATNIDFKATNATEAGTFKLYLGANIYNGEITTNHQVFIDGKVFANQSGFANLSVDLKDKDIHFDFTDLAGNTSVSYALLSVSPTTHLDSTTQFSFIV